MSKKDWIIAPGILLSQLPTNLTLDCKIDLFEKRIQGWQLDIADYLINNPTHAHKDAAFAALDILLSYFEMIGKYYYGYPQPVGQSEKHFKKGVTLVFPKYQNTNVPKILYEGARCGLYHVGSTSSNIYLEGGNAPSITPDNGKVTVNPHKLVLDLKKHFDGYVSELKNPNNLGRRQNFEIRFDIDIFRKISTNI